MELVHRLEQIVEDIQAQWDEVGGAPYYLYGSAREIFNILSSKGNSSTYKFKKYPLIALLINYDDDVVNGEVTYKSFHIIIMTQTKAEYRTSNRLDISFTPTLIPLYNLLIDAIKDSQLLLSDNDYNHTKRNRPYWGEDDIFGSSLRVGNDLLDAIVINNFELRASKCIQEPDIPVVHPIVEHEFLDVNRSRNLLVLPAGSILTSVKYKSRGFEVNATNITIQAPANDPVLVFTSPADVVDPGVHIPFEISPTILITEPLAEDNLLVVSGLWLAGSIDIYIYTQVT